MIILHDTPAPSQTDFNAFYAQMAREGLIHSGVMCGERFERSEIFDDEWACEAVSWSSGGEERYEFDSGRAALVKSAGIMTIAAGDRYTYQASDDIPFQSNMIAFPRWISQSARRDSLEQHDQPTAQISTRHDLASPGLERNLTRIIAMAKTNATPPEDLVESLVLLHAVILDEQHVSVRASRAIPARKKSTQAELTRRVARAKDIILANYDDPALTLSTLSTQACLSVYHLIRVFKALTRRTPMQFLAHTRMNAALRLLRDTSFTIKEVAARTGYSDRAAFYRAFNRHHGMAPSQARVQ